jgi:hypothetical protein
MATGQGCQGGTELLALGNAETLPGMQSTRGDYFSIKNEKLFCEQQESSKALAQFLPPYFAGLTFWLDGQFIGRQGSLRDLIVAHGGSVVSMRALLPRSRAFLVVDALTDSLFNEL